MAPRKWYGSSGQNFIYMICICSTGKCWNRMLQLIWCNIYSICDFVELTNGLILQIRYTCIVAVRSPEGATLSDCEPRTADNAMATLFESNSRCITCNNVHIHLLETYFNTLHVEWFFCVQASRNALFQICLLTCMPNTNLAKARPIRSFVFVSVQLQIANEYSSIAHIIVDARMATKVYLCVIFVTENNKQHHAYI